MATFGPANIPQVVNFAHTQLQPRGSRIGNFFGMSPVGGEDELQRRWYMAQMLLQQANSQGQSPVGSLIGNVIGALQMRHLGKEGNRLESEAQGQRERFNKALGEALSGGDRNAIAQALLSSGDPTYVSKALDLSLDSSDPMQVVGGAIYNKETGEWIQPPSKPGKPTRVRPGDVLVGDDGKPIFTAPGKAGGAEKPTPSAEREALADKYGLTGDAKTRFVLTGQMPSTAAAAGSATEQARRERNQGAIVNLKTSIERMGELAKNMNTGPLIGAAWQLTADGQKFKTEVATMVSSFRALQRVPGSGADTDRELSILLDQAPNLLFETEANLYILDRLREKAKLYEDVMSKSQTPAPKPIEGSAIAGGAIGGADTKTIGGKTYVKKDGVWYEQ